MDTLELPDYNREEEEGISDQKLEELRKKTFTPDLTGLISRVTSHNEDQSVTTDSEIESVSTDDRFNLLKKIHQLMYRSFSDLSFIGNISIDAESDGVTTQFEYELQKYDIHNYGFYCYSMEDEAYKSVCSRKIDREYIGIYSPELEEALKSQYLVKNGFVFLSLIGILEFLDKNLKVNSRLLPIAILQVNDFNDNIYRSLISSTSLVQIMASLACSCGIDRADESLITIKKVHREVVRLQHNYYLVPESICYILTYKYAGSADHIKQCQKLYSDLKKCVGTGSSLYLFNNTTIIAFLEKSDIEAVHNHYLSIRTDDLLLFNIEDFKGKNFLKRVYSAAYNKKLHS